ncbi:MAG: BatA and WFA domain-containing protein [Planctomycetaceae bacterium]
MSFLHPVLLGLFALAAVPVVLHFLMRPVPKRLIFPALRLIETRRKTNVRRLRLRHLWLLLLRMALIALLVFAIARPLVPAANYGLTTTELVMLLVVAGACVAGYLLIVRWWRTQRVAQHEFLYRRTMLRAATGVAAALLVALLVAWPYARRVGAEIADPGRIVAEDRPVAAVFLFDTSRSMEYQFEGASRLEAAKKIASAHLAALPAGSRVAVADSSGTTPIVFQADLAGAKERIETLRAQSAFTALDDRIRAAFDLQEQDREQALDEQSAVEEQLRRDAFLRAVYVFSDQAASAWSKTPGRTLHERLETQPWLQLYLVDVGVEQPANVGLTALRPSEEVTTTGHRVMIRADISSVGEVPNEAVVEFYVDGESGPIKQGQSARAIEPGQAVRVEFPLSSITPPIVRGELRLVRGDPYAPDDVRYFTVAIEPPSKVLIVSDRTDDAFVWSQALRVLRYDVTRIATGDLGKTSLEEFDAAYLLNAESPASAGWERLADYVRDGGGLGVLLGARVDSFVYNGDAAQAILPARLLTQIAFSPPERFHPIDDGHPVFARIQELGGYGWLTTRDVNRHYIVEPNAGTGTIANYTYDAESRPALIVRPIGGGRVAMLTTGVDATRGWSDLPKAKWQFVAFADQLTQFVAGRSGGRRNYSTGEEAVLRLGRATRPDKLLLRSPDLAQSSIDVPKGERRVTIPDLDEVGHYEIVSPPGTPEFTAGFSVSLPAEESDFTRISAEELDGRLGEGRYSVARDPKSLAVVVRDTTLGAELMPYLLMLVVTVFCGEHLVANRFYGAEQDPDHR